MLMGMSVWRAAGIRLLSRPYNQGFSGGVAGRYASAGTAGRWLRTEIEQFVRTEALTVRRP